MTCGTGASPGMSGASPNALLLGHHRENLANFMSPKPNSKSFLSRGSRVSKVADLLFRSSQSNLNKIGDKTSTPMPQTPASLSSCPSAQSSPQLTAFLPSSGQVAAMIVNERIMGELGSMDQLREEDEDTESTVDVLVNSRGDSNQVIFACGSAAARIGEPSPSSSIKSNTADNIGNVPAMSNGNPFRHLNSHSREHNADCTNLSSRRCNNSLTQSASDAKLTLNVGTANGVKTSAHKATGGHSSNHDAALVDVHHVQGRAPSFAVANVRDDVTITPTFLTKAAVIGKPSNSTYISTISDTMDDDMCDIDNDAFSSSSSDSLDFRLSSYHRPSANEHHLRPPFLGDMRQDTFSVHSFDHVDVS